MGVLAKREEWWRRMRRMIQEKIGVKFHPLRRMLATVSMEVMRNGGGVMKEIFGVLRQVTMWTQRNTRARTGECIVLGQNALPPLIVFKHVSFFVFDIFGHWLFCPQ